MTRQNVAYSSAERVTEEADGTEFSKESKSTSWEVYGLHIDPQGQVFANFPVRKGDSLHLVYAVWSTGDSFSHHEGASIEFFTVHKDAEMAERNAQSLRNWSVTCDKSLDGMGDHDDGGHVRVRILTDSGIEWNVAIPWDGYFETLDHVSVVSFTVDRA